MLIEKIKEDLNFALKEKDELKVKTLRLILNAYKNKLIEKGIKDKADLTEEEVLDLLIKEANKRKEAILFYEKGQRFDLLEEEKKELEIIESYLPKKMTDEELKEYILDKIEVLKNEKDLEGSDLFKNFGKVMGILAKELKGRADNQKISQFLKEILGEK